MENKAFYTSSEVERVSLSQVIPYLRLKTPPVLVNLVKFIPPDIDPAEIPDGFLESNPKHTIEFKAEQEYTGNFFMESWSNLITRRKGWSHTCMAIDMYYNFLDTDSLYKLDWQLFKPWYIENRPKYTPTDQKKVKQNNHTTGILVPIILLQDLGICDKEVHYPRTLLDKLGVKYERLGDR